MNIPCHFNNVAPDKFSYSKFVRCMFGGGKVLLPHTTSRRFKEKREISIGQLRPNSLIFFSACRSKMSRSNLCLKSKCFVDTADDYKITITAVGGKC